MIEVYTDGACSGNPGPGGWAWAVDGGQSASGGDPETTNQRMELRAALEAVQTLERPVRVVSDSTYVVNCFRDKWYEGWKKRGWRNANKNPVANRDLWEPLIAEHLKGGIEWQWVKGHSGDRMNDLVDQLAVIESTRLKEAAANPAPPDIAPPWPIENAIIVSGITELNADQEGALRKAIASLNADTDIVVSGMRRGAELAASEICVETRVRLAVVLPFPDPAARWPDALRERFDVAYSASTWQVDLGANPAQPGTAIKARNAWLLGAGLGAIIVGDIPLATEFDAAGLSVVRID